MGELSLARFICCSRVQFSPTAATLPRRVALLAARCTRFTSSSIALPLSSAQFFLSGHIASLCVKLHLVHLQRLQLNCISTPAPTPRQFTSHPLRRTATQRSPRHVSVSSPFYLSPQIPNQGTCLGLNIRYHSLYLLACLSRSSRPSKESFAPSLASPRLRTLPPSGLSRSLVRSLFQVYNHHSRSLSLSTRSSAIPLCLSLTFKPSRLRFLRCGQQISLCKKGGDRPPDKSIHPH